jgi:RNA polymerase sigma-54 factor
MALSQRLDLRQSQNLVLTPQLQQAIKLLQLNNVELTEYVEGELAQNPLLDRTETDGPAVLESLEHDNLLRHGDGEAVAAPSNDGDGFGDAPAGPDTVDQTTTDRIPGSDSDPTDTDYDNNWGSASVSETDGVAAMGAGSGELGNWKTSGGGRLGESDDFERTIEDRKSLRDHLLDQMSMDILEPADRLVAAHLIDMVEPSGYLGAEWESVAETLSCSIERVEAVIQRLQLFDPAGVCARSLKECLGRQLQERNRLDPYMEALLDNLDMLAKRDLPGLRKVCGCDAEDLADMITELKTLDPKPGEKFDPVDEQPVIPDVLMRRGQDGNWLIELNSETLPRVLVNNGYFSEVSRSVSKDKKAKEYLSDCLQSANWLVRSLHQRATTILKVSTELVRQQDAFFEHGVQHLRPLVLRDIADAIGMHESTVSRVTSNKFISTPRGNYELKYFFTSSIASSGGGEAHSAESVRHRIKTLIDAEDPRKVLSDDRIVELLRADGVDIARRTVAKYREALRIPSSVQRRREKGMAATVASRV